MCVFFGAQMTLPPRFQRAVDVSEARAIANSSNQKVAQIQVEYDSLFVEHKELQIRAQKDHLALQEEKAKNDTLQSEVRDKAARDGLLGDFFVLPVIIRCLLFEIGRWSQA